MLKTTGSKIPRNEDDPLTQSTAANSYGTDSTVAQDEETADDSTNQEGSEAPILIRKNSQDDLVQTDLEASHLKRTPNSAFEKLNKTIKVTGFWESLNRTPNSSQNLHTVALNRSNRVEELTDTARRRAEIIKAHEAFLKERQEQSQRIEAIKNNPRRQQELIAEGGVSFRNARMMFFATVSTAAATIACLNTPSFLELIDTPDQACKGAVYAVIHGLSTAALTELIFMLYGVVNDALAVQRGLSYFTIGHNGLHEQLLESNSKFKNAFAWGVHATWRLAMLPAALGFLTTFISDMCKLPNGTFWFFAAAGILLNTLVALGAEYLSRNEEAHYSQPNKIPQLEFFNDTYLWRGESAAAHLDDIKSGEEHDFIPLSLIPENERPAWLGNGARNEMGYRLIPPIAVLMLLSYLVFRIVGNFAEDFQLSTGPQFKPF